MSSFPDTFSPSGRNLFFPPLPEIEVHQPEDNSKMPDIRLNEGQSPAESINNQSPASTRRRTATVSHAVPLRSRDSYVPSFITRQGTSPSSSFLAPPIAGPPRHPSLGLVIPTLHMPTGNVALGPSSSMTWPDSQPHNLGAGGGSRAEEPLQKCQKLARNRERTEDSSERQDPPQKKQKTVRDGELAEDSSEPEEPQQKRQETIGNGDPVRNGSEAGNSSEPEEPPVKRQKIVHSRELAGNSSEPEDPSQKMQKTVRNGEQAEEQTSLL
ncbi:hypothetical protein F5Y12DRAFT_502988 [Xylaria sp. FL1777]|nr:hypothetical protein F5Y12DRAFT_502988 [Xylaria sp. FL1777]